MLLNKHIKYSFLLMLFLFINTSASQELARVNLILTGEVVKFSCSVDSNDNLMVNLKEWNVKDIRNINDKTTAIPFNIRLINCPENSSAKIKFEGMKDQHNSHYLAINTTTADSASGVAIAILDSNMTSIPIGDYSPPVTIGNDGSTTMNFFANYITTKNNPTPGLAVSTATFFISYE